jgi:hypothetical protein
MVTCVAMTTNVEPHNWHREHRVDDRLGPQMAYGSTPLFSGELSYLAEFLISMICCIRGVLASQVAASSMKSIFIASRYNAGGGIRLLCWKSYSSWVSQRSAGDFPSYPPAISNFGRRIAKGRVGKAELDMMADCFGAWDCKSPGRRDKSPGSAKRIDNVGWKASNSLIERSVRIFRKAALRRLIKGFDLRCCRSCWVASTRNFPGRELTPPLKLCHNFVVRALR